MIREIQRFAIALTTLILLLPTIAVADTVLFSAAGPNAAAIQSTVDQFRASLGGINNGNNPGPLASGRREINWDGAAATTATTSGTPFAGFQNIRGALFTTPGTGFLQTPLNVNELLNINPTYGATFGVFSPARIFTPLGSNITDVFFSVPGTTTAALVSGFGSVFTDVDLLTSTSIEFFDINNSSLGLFFAPPAIGNQTFSFLGVTFDSALISRVRITSGNTALGPNDGGGVDVVAMDDFIYGEPQAAPVPEPATLLLLGTGLAGVAGAVRRRRTASNGKAE